MSLVSPSSTRAIVCPRPVAANVAPYALRNWLAEYPHTSVGKWVVPNILGSPVA